MAQRKWYPVGAGVQPKHAPHSLTLKRALVVGISVFAFLILVFSNSSSSTVQQQQQQQQLVASAASASKIATLSIPLEDLEQPQVPKTKTVMQQRAEAAEQQLANSDSYPAYDLPTNGQDLRQVQHEVSAADVPQQQHSANDKQQQKPGLTDQDLFEDWEAYQRAPIITSPQEEAHNLKYREIVLQHERYYRNSKDSRLYVPRLRKDTKLTVSQFAQRFVKRSQPVIVPFEAMRHLGFNTKSYTVDELLRMYPDYKRSFVYKYGRVGPGELDLGPAVWALKQGEALRKTPAGRNFPRNTKISLDQISTLKVQTPPFVLPDTSMLPPSLWFATKTSSTVFHSDCCDNYAMMILGTKRWTITPPHEARILTPTCQGGLCWVRRLEHPDEHAKTEKEQELASRIQKVTFDLGPGEMLFLPTGFFHHVEQDGPTIMINLWTHGGPGFLRFLDGSMDQTMADLERRESAEFA